MTTLLLFIVGLAVTLGIVVALASFAWRSRAPHKAVRDDFVAREAAQAAFISGVPSQVAMLGMESALPYLSGLYIDLQAPSSQTPQRLGERVY